MRYSWQFLSTAFGALILLVIGSGLTLNHRIDEIRSEIGAIQRSSQHMEEALTDLREHVFSLALFTRDYLMHEGPSQYSADRRELLNRRRALLRDLEEMKQVLPASDKAEVQRIEEIVNSYLRSSGVVFGWSVDEKRYFGRQYIRDQLTPQRDALLKAIAQLNELYHSHIARRQSRILATQQLIQTSTRHIVAVTAILSLLIAAYTVLRLRRLEAEAERQHAQLERDQEHLRRLSHELVRAQEEERKSLSRELHDQVGQTLTALRMEVGNLGTLRSEEDPAEFEEHLESAKHLSEQALHTVRDLSMGLRPSMLDDLGLEPAIRWQARNFTRSSRIPVDLQMEGALDSLPEPHRISVFRIVQEALNNCAKHSKASEVRVTLHGGHDRLTLSIQDDGRGFTPGEGERGVGLIGIEERVRELGGSFHIFAAPDRGALLTAEFPLQSPVPDEQNTHSVGR